MSKTALTPVEQKQVVFYEDEITAVLVNTEQNTEIFVPVKPICDLLGIDWRSQRRRISDDPVLSKKVQGVVIMTPPSSDGRGGGEQTALCLPLGYLNGWLFGISASRVKPEIKDRLLVYQENCYNVLAEAFQEGRLTADPTFDELLQSDSEAVQAYKMLQALVKLARNQILIESRLDEHEDRLEQLEAQLGDTDRAVTPAQASQISQAVKAIALEMSKKSGRNEFGGVYGELYRRFEITSYKQIPAYRFDEVMKFLSEWYQQLGGDVPF